MPNIITAFDTSRYIEISGYTTELRYEKGTTSFPAFSIGTHHFFKTIVVI